MLISTTKLTAKSIYSYYSISVFFIPLFLNRCYLSSNVVSKSKYTLAFRLFLKYLA